MKEVTIATRGSRLALWQAHFIGKSLKGLKYKILEVSTQGDRVQDRYLHEIGGKGLFVKEVEKALLDGKADLAVHSLKDMPVNIDPRFCFAAIPKRHARGDLLVFNDDVSDKSFHALSSLKVGTSSLRRQNLLLSRYQCKNIEMLRGNIDTRLKKLKEGRYDAIILAAAAIERLKMELPHALEFDASKLIPSACQGTLAVQTRKDCEYLDEISELDDPVTHNEAKIERGVLRALGGDCTMPCGISVYTSTQHWTVDTVVVDGKGNRAEATIKQELGDFKAAIEAAMVALKQNNLDRIMHNLGLSSPDV